MKKQTVFKETHAKPNEVSANELVYSQSQLQNRRRHVSLSFKLKRTMSLRNASLAMGLGLGLGLGAGRSWAERYNVSSNGSKVSVVFQNAALSHVGWFEEMRFVTMGLLGPFLEVSGLVTSVLSIVLLKLDRSIQASVRIILVALAVADIFFLSGAIFCVQIELYAAMFGVSTLQAIKGSFLQSSSCSVVNIAEVS